MALGRSWVGRELARFLFFSLMRPIHSVATDDGFARLAADLVSIALPSYKLLAVHWLLRS
jgi:hypothetical protein